MKRSVFLGPPGAGKGTAAVQIAGQTGARHLSTGDLLRAAVKAGTELGIKAKSYMDAGGLVPDELIVGLIREELAGGLDSFILDGFPRTLAQAEALDPMLTELGKPLDGVLLFAVDDEVLVRRLSGRISCPECGAVYHKENNPPKAEGICDKCATALATRPDDREEVVRNRLQVYAEQTKPLVEYYRSRGVLNETDASRSVNEVYDSLKTLFPIA